VPGALVPVALAAVALAAAAVATARLPCRFRLRSQRHHVLLVDVSVHAGSRMSRPTRLDAPRRGMRTFIDLLPRHAACWTRAVQHRAEGARQSDDRPRLLRESLGYLAPRRNGDWRRRRCAVRARATLAEPSGRRAPAGGRCRRRSCCFPTARRIRVPACRSPVQRRLGCGIKVDTISLGTPHGALIVLGRAGGAHPIPRRCSDRARNRREHVLRARQRGLQKHL